MLELTTAYKFAEKEIRNIYTRFLNNNITIIQQLVDNEFQTYLIFIIMII